MSKMPDFYQLDESWYRYMKADRKERKEMCETNLNVIAVAYGIGFAIIIGIPVLGFILSFFE